MVSAAVKLTHGILSGTNDETCRGDLCLPEYYCVSWFLMQLGQLLSPMLDRTTMKRTRMTPTIQTSEDEGGTPSEDA